ncbi:unnamed protein product, partial [Closterium sp. NIES-54]
MKAVLWLNGIRDSAGRPAAGGRCERQSAAAAAILPAHAPTLSLPLPPLIPTLPVHSTCLPQCLPKFTLSLHHPPRHPPRHPPPQPPSPRRADEYLVKRPAKPSAAESVQCECHKGAGGRARESITGRGWKRLVVAEEEEEEDEDEEEEEGSDDGSSDDDLERGEAAEESEEEEEEEGEEEEDLESEEEEEAEEAEDEEDGEWQGSKRKGGAVKMSQQERAAKGKAKAQAKRKTKTGRRRRRNMSICGETCLCRMLHVSCSKHCGCGSSCQNAPFHRRPSRKVKLCRTDKCGWGLKANEDLPAGCYVMEYVGQ